MKLKEVIKKHNELKIEISKKAITFVEKQTKEVRERIFSKLDYSIDNPESIIRLKGEPIKYKIRVGDMRIILIIIKNPKGIKILEIGNRGQIYK